MLRGDKRQKRAQSDFTGKSDRGSLDFKSKLSHHDGDIMMVAKRDVVQIPPTMTIMGAVKTMVKYRFRRLPVSDPGTNRLVGIVTVMDVVNFLGGGDKAQIIEHKHKGNLLSAINEEISSIMEEDVVTLHEDDSIDYAIKKMLEANLGGFPIVTEDGRVLGIVSERDFVSLVANVVTGKKVADFMSRDVVTVKPDTPVEEAARVMISHDFRRVPIVHEGVMIGVITSSDIVQYLGTGEVFDKLVTGNMHEALGVPIKILAREGPITVDPDLDLGEAADLMIARDVSVLPVVVDGTLAGIMTERDFLNAIVG
ncbi:MAG TPA: CBS domain-containing protein [Candidatus Bathyarchaeia archaeon]|nr:CBS domain-containing protein [Candidatus Bathyarchaeia archaeon]